MRIVIAPDSFKESMTAPGAARAMALGAADALPDAAVELLPVSDGGEGFARTLTALRSGEWIEVPTVDALGRPVTAGLGLSGPEGRRSAALDLAGAAGLERIRPAERDVMRSSTRGLGLLLRAAMACGAGDAVVGIGGSATNDMGLGMLAALGAAVLDGTGRPVEPVPAAFDRIATIDIDPARERLAGVDLTVACDVTNPLLGPSGATAVFGPQKGVNTERVAALDAEIGRLAGLMGLAHRVEDPGAGAAGGVGFALAAALGARIVPGFEIVARAAGLEERIADADLVLTGEGAVDAQSLEGKAVGGVVRAARRHGVPVMVLAGVLRDGAERLRAPGVELIEITPPGEPAALALARGAVNLRSTVRRALSRR
ncbi:MAG: glycerate kinase [Actinomyces sp.]|uniref:glycerate kinase family protein n=1 Tax=Actinomyces sp. TaxID=29317 RepID=UPI0026DD8E60|nr:glycerate kinase [Actinomyces sp.]MDO4243627.1 glycerate kinase [Actinomyces sp.]